jgi:hypothetical protein
MSWLLSQLLISQPCGETFNAAYIKKALAKTLATVKPKRSGFFFFSQNWIPYSDDASVPITTAVQQFKLWQKHQDDPYLPDIFPADFFLFPRVKSELAG